MNKIPNTWKREVLEQDIYNRQLRFHHTCYCVKYVRKSVRAMYFEYDGRLGKGIIKVFPDEIGSKYAKMTYFF